ncbi:unnamed protein product [Rotaria sordida]|uniref:G-protein coupled receptors family 1 profile domain-containing protein n=1 Tax=Rotaria sordida TaxID=392033 RepID=A0A819U8E2_9BILA|nr:unnamed protein product [Rotaria sordida]
MLCTNSSSYLNENRCLLGYCSCPKEYYFNKDNDIHYNAITLPMIGAILYDLRSLRYVYCFILILLALIGIINNIFSLMTFIRKRIRHTICGIYLINYSICSLVLMILILTNIITAIYYDKYLFRLWSCYGYPYISLIMVYTSILISSVIAIEGVFYTCFNFDQFSRLKRPLIISFLFLLIVSISNLDKIFGRSLLIDQSGNFYCIYKKYSFKYWSIILYYIYIIIPCLIHMICIICVLLLLIKENCFQKITTHKSWLIPSLFIIFCMFLNGLFLNLFNFCLTYPSNNINRLHIIFIFLLYTPQFEVECVRKPVFVLACDQGFFDELQGAIHTLDTYWSDHRIIFYDLGISNEQEILLRMKCAQCTIIKFPFSSIQKFARHIGDLTTYAFKPFVIQDALRRYGTIIYADSSIRFNSNAFNPVVIDNYIRGFAARELPGHYVSCYTHTDTFTWFNQSYTNFDNIYIAEAGFVVVTDTFLTRLIMKAWLTCALEPECLITFRSQTNCSRTSLNKHRYDQSAIVIILSYFFFQGNKGTWSDKKLNDPAPYDMFTSIQRSLGDIVRGSFEQYYLSRKKSS